MHTATDYVGLFPLRFGTKGTGPMWLSRLACKGTESNLHQCPHGGFNDSPIDEGSYAWGCNSHTNDAYVSCYNKRKPINMLNSYAMLCGAMVNKNRLQIKKNNHYAWRKKKNTGLSVIKC